MQDKANSRPSPKFKPINGPADETPTKRQRTTSRIKNTDKNIGNNKESFGMMQNCKIICVNNTSNLHTNKSL